ncbi:MAG: F420-0--gamma-glutamyl ligase [Lachnospiraceae bacterium]|nr:F420-0--gamma-glutamyl ligase [Lachnospiraceae bacterium]
MYITEPNKGKNREINTSYGRFARYPVTTPVIVKGDDMAEILRKNLRGRVEKEDIIFLSEKSVACAQGRAIPLEDIHPGKLAVTLSHFVHKSPHGIGLSMPETMEVTLRECGRTRILLAAAVSAVGRLFGRNGWFYLAAGKKAAAVDGPCPYTIPPYNRYVVPAPLHPNEECRRLSSTLGCQVAIVDINDLGGKVLGVSSKKMNRKMIVQALRDNPLGQEDEHTPAGILRALKKNCLYEND